MAGHHASSDLSRPRVILRALGLLVAGTLPVLGAWTEAGGYRWRPLAAPGDATASPGFEAMAPERTGVLFTNDLPELQGATNRVLFNGSGVACGDYDGDGLVDLYLTSLNGTNALYRNLGGWRFEDRTAAAGLSRRSHLDRGAVFADLSGDGRLDLLVATTGRGVLFFLNLGEGRFREVTDRVGTRLSGGATTLAVADVDGDRFLDLYVANYRTDDIKDQERTVEVEMRDGRMVVPPDLADRLTIEDGQLLQYGEPDVLFLNDRRGRMLPAGWTDGTFLAADGKPLRAVPRDWGLTATFRDLNADGFPDLYVCNDFWTPDRIWLGDGRGHFRAADPTAFRTLSGSSMGVDVADIDRDGAVDLLVLEMLSRDPARRKRQVQPHQPAASVPGVVKDQPQVLRNTLFRGRGDGTFAEIARYAGLAATEWSWSPHFLDVDLDGYEDVLITAGHVRDILDADAVEQVRADVRSRPPARDRGEGLMRRVERDRWFPELRFPLLAYRNRGDLRFEERTREWGDGSPGIHHALATADFDGDGDQDVVVTQLNGPVRLYRNRGGATRVAVRLKGRKPNVQGIGAHLRFEGPGMPRQTAEVVSGGRYMAGSDVQVTFAAGVADGNRRLEVVWRSGSRTVLDGLVSGRLYEVDEPEPPGTPATPPGAGSVEPLFADVSRLLAHQHVESVPSDLERQPLLPWRVSQWGPGVSVGDVDGDGDDDLAVGGGRGGRPGLFLGDGRGTFRAVAWTDAVLERDQGGWVRWRGLDGGSGWLVTQDNVEEDRSRPSTVSFVGMDGRGRPEPGLGLPDAVGPLALGDPGDGGGPVLFVGGRLRGGQYPMAAESGLFRFREGRWQAQAVPMLKGFGRVNGAVWTDLDGDGMAELVVADEWAPIRVMAWRGGTLVETTAEWGLDRETGLWSGVTTGDFNADGLPDLVVGNRGLNTGLEASVARPLELWYGSFSGQGLDVVETEWDPVRSRRTPSRRLGEMTTALPWLAERYSTHREYSEAGLESVLQGHSHEARHVSANTLAVRVLLQEGKRFRPVVLPPEAQFSPVSGVAVADADGDGNEDVFLAQNFFATRAEVSRHDAGTGLWLLGNGQGGFRALSPSESGVSVPGEQRGAAVGDFNADGRADLVVAQNGSATRLYLNRRAKPGLRVRLETEEGRPGGIGASVRLVWGERVGPAREVHAGSGHGSEDSGTLVLGQPQPAARVRVRWPGGVVQEQPIPSGAPLVVLRRPRGR